MSGHLAVHGWPMFCVDPALVWGTVKAEHAHRPALRAKGRGMSPRREGGQPRAALPRATSAPEGAGAAGVHGVSGVPRGLRAGAAPVEGGPRDPGLPVNLSTSELLGGDSRAVCVLLVSR